EKLGLINWLAHDFSFNTALAHRGDLTKAFSVV
ncbi:unnamed protein product, partial [marine sediment metagenome]